LEARDITCRVRANREVSSGIYRATLEPVKGTVPDAAPGQFAMIQVKEKSGPLLRRPLSYLQAGAGRIEFLYRVVGVGTRILAQAKKNDELKVLGPLGSGFELSAVKSNALLVAGGIGIAPIYFLAMKLVERKIPKIEVVYGARTAREILFAEDLEKAGIAVRIVTDDGSAGKRALASKEAAKAMGANKPDAVFACGPYPMLRAVAESSARIGAPCQVSIEERMACGVGACMGCAVKTEQGYLHVCCDGPVFDASVLFKI